MTTKQAAQAAVDAVKRLRYVGIPQRLSDMEYAERFTDVSRIGLCVSTQAIHVRRV